MEAVLQISGWSEMYRMRKDIIWLFKRKWLKISINTHNIKEMNFFDVTSDQNSMKFLPIQKTWQ